jgi:repressor LexA
MSQLHFLLPKNNRPVLDSSLLEEAELGLSDIVDHIEIPLLGIITAGKPIERVVDEERIRVPANMVRKDTYALRVSGHSMIDDNIQDGDIVIIEKRLSAENGQSVVALINNEQVTLKKFYIEADGIRLQPANPDMEPILLKNEEVQVLGVVTGVIRKFD